MEKDKNKIEIGGVLETIKQWDLGLMPHPDKKKKIDKKLWEQFVEARENYSILYSIIEEFFN